MKIAFLTAGGNAPCLSSSIGKLIQLYSEKIPSSEMIGYIHGYKGLLKGNSIRIDQSIINNAERGDHYISFNPNKPDIFFMCEYQH